MSEWWLEDLDPRLSQGDIVGPLPFAIAPSKSIYLKKQTGKNGVIHVVDTHQRSEATTPVTIRCEERLLHGIVLSYSCDLDKKPAPKRVQVAPLINIESLDAGARDDALEQKIYAQFALPDIPTLGTYVADLRSTTALHIDVVSAAPRLASMTKAALQRLHAQVIAYYTRRQVTPT